MAPGLERKDAITASPPLSFGRQQSAVVTRKNAVPGLRVERGPHWKYADQVPSLAEILVYSRRWHRK